MSGQGEEMTLTRIFPIVALVMSAAAVQATGHFPHKRGEIGDWWWKDVQGFYSAHTNGASVPGEHFNVFCNDPDSLGGVRLQISVRGDQVGDHRMTLSFDNGRSIDVIATYGGVSASSAAGRAIIADIMTQLRTAGSVIAVTNGAPPARFSLRGSSGALKPCP